MAGDSTDGKREVTMEQIKKTFEAGFIAACQGFYRLPEEEQRKRMYAAWRKFCGIDT